MRVPQWIVPALVAAFTLLGIGGARLLAVPSVTRDFNAAGLGVALRTTVFVVDGLKCVDTAERAASQFRGVPGVIRFAAYASRNRAEVTFDPGVTSPPALKEALEGPAFDPSTGEYLFNVYRVVEMDGVKVAEMKP